MRDNRSRRARSAKLRGSVPGALAAAALLSGSVACGGENGTPRPIPLRVFCAAKELIQRDDFRVSEPGTDPCREGILREIFAPAEPDPESSEDTGQTDGSASPAQ